MNNVGRLACLFPGLCLWPDVDVDVDGLHKFLSDCCSSDSWVSK